MNIRNSLALLFAAVIFSACSQIADDERLIFVEHVDIGGSNPGKLFTPTVLIEDFTGQRCTWCPSGTRVIEQQQELYGAERVIPVAIHSGNLGFRGNATAVGLMTDLGEYYWNANGFTSATSQPTAVFNRRHTTDVRDEWEGHVRNELTRQVSADIQMESTYDAASRTITLTTTCFAQAAIDANLQLWLVENGINAMQIDEGVTRRDYIHNHVLRDAINGNDGEAVTLSTTPATVTTTYIIPEHCNAENCEIVAFLYNNTGVLQAAKHHVVDAE